jgi:hypothetical protein
MPRSRCQDHDCDDGDVTTATVTAMMRRPRPRRRGDHDSDRNYSDGGGHARLSGPLPVSVREIHARSAGPGFLRARAQVA